MHGEEKFHHSKGRYHFDGYSPQLTMFCSMQKGVLSDNIYHWLHSAMVEEQRIKYPWLRAAFTWYNDFDGLVSVSEGVMGQNQKSLLENFGISSSNHLTIENLLGPKRILELSKEPISDLGEEWLKKDHKSILVVGRFAPEKNHASLLKAFANIKESLPELKLGFMGKGPQEAYIRQLVKELNLESVVSFLGHESNPYPLIKAADIVFQPSIHEGQGIVLLEALTLGTKVFASDIPPFRSVLGDGIYGDLFSPTVKGIEGALLSIQASKLSETRNFDAEDYELRAQSKLLALLNGEL